MGLAAPELGMTTLLCATVDVRNAESAAAVREEASCLRAIVEIKECNMSIGSTSKIKIQLFEIFLPPAKSTSRLISTMAEIDRPCDCRHAG
jgi:hypothetical protein